MLPPDGRPAIRLCLGTWFLLNLIASFSGLKSRVASEQGQHQFNLITLRGGLPRGPWLPKARAGPPARVGPSGAGGTGRGSGLRPRLARCPRRSRRDWAPTWALAVSAPGALFIRREAEAGWPSDWGQLVKGLLSVAAAWDLHRPARGGGNQMLVAHLRPRAGLWAGTAAVGALPPSAPRGPAAPGPPGGFQSTPHPAVASAEGDRTPFGSLPRSRAAVDAPAPLAPSRL